MKNYGLILKPISDDKKAFILGSSSMPFTIRQADGNWKQYLPEAERQSGMNDTFNCTGFGTLTQIEVFMKAVFGEDVNYSDRALGIFAGTWPPGNDPQKVYEAIRKNGLVPESMLPFIDAPADEYYSFKGADEAACRKAGEEWKEKYEFLHEWVFGDGLTWEERKQNMRVAIKSSPLALAVYAWKKNTKDIYVSKGVENHWVMCYSVDDLERVFDSYEPFLKDVDQIISYCKRIEIKKRVNKDKWLVALLKVVMASIKLRSKVPDVVVPPTPSAPPVKSPRERFYEAALAALGTDASPKDVAPDELGCAETVNEIHYKAFGEYIENPGISTTRLFAAIVDRPDLWVRVSDAEPGNLIISPTGMSKLPSLPIANGHVGIFDRDGIIMSNSSATGKFERNYTIQEWVDRYRVKGGYPIYYFKRINMQRKFGALSSSEDPQKLADTVKGIIIGAATLIIFVAQQFGFEVATENITEMAVVLGAAISSVWTLYGIIKKIVIAVRAKYA
jgi:hypothetical protein